MQRIRIADQLVRGKKLEEAEPLLLEILSEMPTSLLVHQRLRDLYHMVGNATKTLQFDKSIQLIRADRAYLNARGPVVQGVPSTPIILIVDPIFRGSRLYYTAMLTEALRSQTSQDIQILTRTHIESDLLPSYRDRLNDAKIEAALDVPENMWYGQVPQVACEQIAKRLTEAKPGTTVVFSGWNELTPKLPEEMLRTNRVFPLNLVAYEYSANSLANPAKRELLARLASVVRSLSIWILDESVGEEKYAIPGVRIKVMPDPIPHFTNSLAMISARSGRSAFIDDPRWAGSKSFLAVGLQSSRKGLRDIIKAARLIRQEKLPAKIFVSGKIAEGEERLAAQVAGLSDIIIARNDYVTDEEILRTYNACDFVLLPYAKDFSGSSGVFAHAMAFGKPVISTDHGCVGWRTTNFNVGLTFNAGDAQGFVASIRDAINWTPETYAGYAARCHEYHRNNSYETTMNNIRQEVTKIAAPSNLGATIASSIFSKIKSAASGSSAPPVHGHSDAHTFSLSSVESIRQICLMDTSIGSRNMGDHIIVDSIKAQLQHAFPNAIFVNVPTHEYLGPESLKLLESSDIRLVCGTNLLASHMDEYKQWKIGGLEYASLREVTLLGCGWWQYQEEPNNYTQLLLNNILSNSTIHSVRDGYSLEKLRILNGKKVLNTTCPTLWSLTPDHLEKIPDTKSKDVVTTLTDYKADPATDKFMLEHLASRYRTVYVWIQGTGDFKYLKRLCDGGKLDIQVIPATLEAYDRLLMSSRELDYVGTRLHASVRALQKGRRSLILAVDNRAREIAADTALPCIPRETAPAELESLIDSFSARKIRLPIESINAWLNQFR